MNVVKNSSMKDVEGGCSFDSIYTKNVREIRLNIYSQINQLSIWMKCLMCIHKTAEVNIAVYCYSA